MMFGKVQKIFGLAEISESKLGNLLVTGKSMVTLPYPRIVTRLNKSLTNDEMSTSIGANLSLDVLKYILVVWSKLELQGPIFLLLIE